MVRALFLEKNFPSLNGHLLDFKPLLGWFGALKIEVKIGICTYVPALKKGEGGAKAIRAMPKCLGHEFQWGFP